MLTFLFWNLRGNPLGESVRRLAAKHGIDVFVFAECRDAVSILLALNPIDEASRYNYRRTSATTRIQIFTRFSSKFLSVQSESMRYTIRRIHLPDREDIVLAAAHLLSPLHASNSDRLVGAQQLAKAIRQVESDLGHDRTVVVGDLNLNPFDEGVVSASALHGVMSKAVALRGSRTVQQIAYPLLYNPMWSRFGEHSERPSGSYYYDKSGHNCYFWNLFDQVLIRPSLLSHWNDQDLKILTDDGEHSFLNDRGIPDSKRISDHLPLLFKLNV